MGPSIHAVVDDEMEEFFVNRTSIFESPFLGRYRGRVRQSTGGLRTLDRDMWEYRDRWTGTRCPKKPSDRLLTRT
jgi:hypothetical protein